MTRIFKIAVLACMALLTMSDARAQQPPAPNPLDTIPEKMPFYIPYGANITLDRAQELIAASIAEAKRRDWKMAVAVVDAGANLVAFARMDDAQLAAVALAEHKARSSAMSRRDTKAFETSVQGGNIYQLTLDGMIAVRGGIPLVENGHLIGAIGASGGSGSQDEVTAKAGAALVR